MTTTEFAETGVTDTFGIRSRPLVGAMSGFAVIYLIVTIYSGRSIDSAASWAGLIAAFLIFVIVGVIILGTRGDPLPLRATVCAASATVVALAAGLFSLPNPPDHVMQTGPPTGCSVIMLAFLAVRGRPLAAWLASGAITVTAALWAAHAGMGAGWGVSITLPGYAVMIMGSLFSVMLRPMTRQIYALRSADAERVAAEAAASASMEFRERQLVEFEERARPTLMSIVDRHDFSDDEIRHARLLEAQLRDGIRAPGLDSPAVRDAVWRARRRGIVVVLLDDGALRDVQGSGADDVRSRLSQAVIDALAGSANGRVTARVLPSGRNLLGTITIDDADRSERIELGLDGKVWRDVPVTQAGRDLGGRRPVPVSGAAGVEGNGEGKENDHGQRSQ